MLTVSVNSSPGGDSVGSIRVEVVVSLREQVWRETSEDPGTDS